MTRGRAHGRQSPHGWFSARTRSCRGWSTGATPTRPGRAAHVVKEVIGVPPWRRRGRRPAPKPGEAPHCDASTTRPPVKKPTHRRPRRPPGQGSGGGQEGSRPKGQGAAEEDGDRKRRQEAATPRRAGRPSEAARPRRRPDERPRRRPGEGRPQHERPERAKVRPSACRHAVRPTGPAEVGTMSQDHRSTPDGRAGAHASVRSGRSHHRPGSPWPTASSSSTRCSVDGSGSPPAT